jgi:hypothetical protein
MPLPAMARGSREETGMARSAVQGDGRFPHPEFAA